MVVHCYAGISRSTAGAYVAACALNPQRDELQIALGYPPRLAHRAAECAHRLASPTACSDATAAWCARSRPSAPAMPLEGDPFRLDIA